MYICAGAICFTLLLLYVYDAHNNVYTIPHTETHTHHIHSILILNILFTYTLPLIHTTYLHLLYTYTHIHIGATVQGKNSFPDIRDIILYNTKPATEYSKHMINNEKESTSIETYSRRLEAINSMKLKRKSEEEDIKKRSF